jgi:UDP-N-acetylglucosamine:LPS N-acetylglucosamine transferase
MTATADVRPPTIAPEAAPRHKVMLVGSSGGHLLQLHAMRALWEGHDRCWVTFDKEDARSLLRGERMHPCAYPTNRNVPNLLRNTALALRLLRRERPDVIVSTGAGVAIPFFVFGRLFGAILVFCEVYDRIDSPTITGRVVQPFCHVFGLQWEEQLKYYRRGVVVGPVL